MKVNCVFDDKDFVIMHNNKLIISNGVIYGEVMIKIISTDGEEEAVTAVDGNMLIKAIQNAMNI